MLTQPADAATGRPKRLPQQQALEPPPQQRMRLLTETPQVL